MKKIKSKYFKIINTIIGPIGLAWNSKGLQVLQLPEASAYLTKARLLEKIEINPSEELFENPIDITSIENHIKAYLLGIIDHRKLVSNIPLDLESETSFAKSVYQILLNSDIHSTTTYKEIAVAAGAPSASRAVGQVIAKNPMPLIIPCHRVLYANGNLGNFSAWSGQELKRKLLVIEGNLLI